MRNSEAIDSPTIAQKNQPYWPYWFIRGKLYDLSPWLEKHPGGADFLSRAQGTDCTAVFEIHHLNMPKAEAMLKQFEVSKDSIRLQNANEKTPHSETPEFDWRQYAILRQRVFKRLKSKGWKPGASIRSKFLAVTGLMINLTIPFIWDISGYWAILLAPLYAMNMIIMTGFGHMFLHGNTRWQYFGDLGGFSSHSWKQEHCLEHHPFTNHPTFDPDVTKFEPILHFTPQLQKRWQKFAPLFLPVLYALAFMLIRIFRPLEIIREPGQRITRIIWFLVGSFGWLGLWWYMDNLLIGLLLECLISFLFLSLTLSNHNHSPCHFQHKKQDFVKHQMDACYDFGSIRYWPSMLSSAFLGSQTLHHLFPTLDPVWFEVVVEELTAMGYQYERHSFWPVYLDHIQFVSGKLS